MLHTVIFIGLCLMVGYLCGCISTAYFVGKMHHIDIRNKLNLKMRLFKVNKQEVMRHLTFYEGKEFDTKKLFKLIKNK